MGAKIHKTADVSPDAIIGERCMIWNNAQIREGAILGKGCIISKNVYVDTNVQIGNYVKVQNNVSIYQGVTIEDGVFIGPHACFTNDKAPRAINPDGSQKSSSDWIVGKTLVKRGSSIGANATILPNVKIGRFALIAAGSVLTKDIPDFGLAVGAPARLKGYVCKCAKILREGAYCEVCNLSLENGSIVGDEK